MRVLYNRLINVLDEQNPNTTNFHIADTLIRNIDILDKKSIKQTAELCAVSKSTISKFVRDMGFDDYWDFRLEVKITRKKEFYNTDGRCNITDYIQKNGIAKYEKTLFSDIDTFFHKKYDNLFQKLAKEIHSYHKIATFGISYSEMAAMNLQHKMHYYQKFLYTTLDDTLQDDYIKNAQKDTLIIIFSNSGNYITEFQTKEGAPKKCSFNDTKAKIVLITSNLNMKKDPRVDECILLDYSDKVQNHLILYQLLIERLASTYENIYGSPDSLLNS